jgi:RNA polymerase sigma factor (sigma-70 family)
MNSGQKFTDSGLIQALKSGENSDEAIRYLYRSQYGMTAAYIKQNSGTDQDAEDIFQELILVFIEVLKKDRFRGESSVSTFLYALTRNIWLNELKKRERSKYRDEIFEKGKGQTDPDVSRSMINREARARLIKLVETMGEACKKILLAFYYENMAMREILKTLDYENEQVVRNKKYKCLKQLEQKLAGQPDLVRSLKPLLYE